MPSNISPSVFVVSNFVQACCWFVPRIPLAGETLSASKVQIEAGGKGLNVAIGLHRLGLSIDSLIGCGTDSAATVLLDLFKKEQMNDQYIFQFEGSSGWGSGWIAQDGQNAIAVSLGANLLLDSSHIEQARSSIEQAQLVYGQFETSITAVQTSFEIARAHNITTVLNPSPWQTPAPSIEQHTHIMICNEIEAQYLLALDDPLGNNIEAIQAKIQTLLPLFWQKWSDLQLLIITLGALGCMAFQRTKSSNVSGELLYKQAKKIHAIDTVGAGDGFACGFCFAYVKNLPLDECLRWGNAFGAHLASHAGVLNILPYSHQLNAILEN